MSMKLSLNQLRLLVFVILSLSQVIYCNEPQESVCDDGKVSIFVLTLLENS